MSRFVGMVGAFEDDRAGFVDEKSASRMSFSQSDPENDCF